MLHAIAALLLLGAVLTGCSDELWTQDNYEGSYTLSVETSKGVSVTTRALTQSGSTITASWATTDHIYVKKDETWASGSLQPKTAGATSTLRGSLSGVSIAANDELTLQFPKSGTLDYTGQKGTLADIAANYDYATAAATVTSVNNGIVTATANTFTNQQAIVKFTLLDKGNSDAALNPSSLTLSDGTNTVSLTDIPATTYTANEATNVLYTAFPAAGTAKNITLTATVNDDHYFYEKPDVTFTNGNYYDITVKMAYDYRHVPLTFEAKTAGAVVTFTSTMPTAPTIEYSMNGGDWTTYTSAITLTNVGDKVSFRGDNATYSNGWMYSNFSNSDDCYIYGNIMSLISSTAYANTTTLTADYAFYQLFYENTHIVNHPSKTLVLPATTLTSSCYCNMFYGCTGLTTTPELPATTLANYCYQSMFYGCTSLTTAPTLPATTLSTCCYQSMFQSCTSLTTAPTLPATTLADYCFQSMFHGCASLTTAPATLPATTLATCCYQVMFSGCTSLATAPELPATTLADYCYQQMFQGCTSLTTAPVLPATTLTTNCYYFMFDGCSNLSSVTCLATDISASNCTNYWLQGAGSNVTGTKTFYKPALADWSGKTGINGIPSDWTIVNLVIDLSTVTSNITVPNGYAITGTLNRNVKISIADGATVMLRDVTINRSGNLSNYKWAGLNCLGDATIILADGTTNTVKGFYQNYPGIHVPSGSTLTINGETAGTGSLTASSNGSAAGIGCGWYNLPCGNIIINGGIITATGGKYGAGIGSGGLQASSCGNITINGGTITATGGERAAGIGAVYNWGSCGDITITGGTVIATGQDDAAGIGGGYYHGDCGNITIANTVTRVTATKGSSADALNSIGGGKISSCGTVTIGGVTGAISTSPYTYQP